MVTSYGSPFIEIYAFAEEAIKENVGTETLIRCGDFNSDGKIDIFDAIRSKREILNKNPQPGNLSDINDDGAFNILDSLILQDYILLRDVSAYKKFNQAGDSENFDTNYKYSIFSGDKENGISLSGEEIIINYDIASNGNIEITGDYIVQPHRNVLENANISTVYMDYKINETYFKNSDTYDEFTVEKGDDVNYIIENPLISYGDISIHKELTLDKTCMMAYNSIEIDNNTINNGDTILYSKYGDITIVGESINLVGLIYAPSGTVKLSAKNVQIDGIIIAKHVIIESSGKININGNTELAEFIGIDTEEMFIPYSEWEYIKKEDDEVFPEIVKEQIYNDPLSVDDAWLRAHYGNEIVNAYNKDMKRQLVETLYIGQSEGICNYRDVINSLNYAVRYGYSDYVWLRTRLPDKNQTVGQLSLGVGSCEIKANRTDNEEFIGPMLPYYGPYKWDFYVDSEDNPEIKEELPDNKKKKFEIKDLPVFTKMASAGATIFEGIKNTSAVALTGLVAYITQGVNIALAESGAKDTLEIAKGKIFEKFAEIADIDLFKKVETVTSNGIKVGVGPFDFNVVAESDKWNVKSYINGELVDLDKLKKITDIDTITSIFKISPKIYGELVEAVNNGTAPSRLIEIIDCIKEFPDDFNLIYKITENLNMTYEFVSATGNAATKLISYVNNEIEKLTKTQRRKFNTACVVVEPTLKEKYFFGRNKGIELSNASKNTLLFGTNGLLPSHSLNGYSIGNCAEVDGINQALNAGGKIENMYMLTIHTTVDSWCESKLACENCTYAFKGRVKLNISGWTN